MAYKVTGAVVTAEVDTSEGRQVRYFYRDAVLPAGIDKDTLKHLEDVELIAKVEESNADDTTAAGDAVREAAEKADADAAAKADARIAAAAKGK